MGKKDLNLHKASFKVLLNSRRVLLQPKKNWAGASGSIFNVHLAIEIVELVIEL